MDKVRLLLADDNFVVRRGLRSILEQEPGFSLVGEASTGGEAVDLFKRESPDVVLLDIRMPDKDGIAVAQEITSLQPDSKMLMLTALDDPVHLVQAMLAGVRGYLVYGRFTPEELVSAVRTVYAGGVIVTPALAPVLLRLVQESPAAKHIAETDPLTPREREVLTLIAAGKNNQDTADALGVEEKTVKNHLSSIYSKLRLKGRYEAIAYALQHGDKDGVAGGRG
ncbi:MAG: response regulator transcription factor [Dehalococcoidia bacterium]